MILPPYKGAVFRGAFGNAFRRLACVDPKANCPFCALRNQCLYVALFEPQPPAGYADAAKFNQAPRPYVLNPPLTSRNSFRSGETLEFDLVLIGPAIEALPYFIHIFIEMGHRGLGRERGKYELLQVAVLQNGVSLPVCKSTSSTLTAFASESGPVHLPEDDRTTSLTVQILTPLRLKEKGDLITRLTFSRFFAGIARRLSLLTAFYSGNGARGPAGINPECNPVFPDDDPLATRAMGIKVPKDDLRWFDWERYSRRQDATMKFGGLKGSITFHGELGTFMPYLRLGESLHVGQSTTFGLGKFQLV